MEYKKGFIMGTSCGLALGSTILFIIVDIIMRTNI